MKKSSNNIRSLKIKPRNNIRPKGKAAIDDSLLDEAADIIKRGLRNIKDRTKFNTKLDKLRDSYKKKKRTRVPNVIRSNTRYGKKIPQIGKYGIPDHHKRLLKIKGKKKKAFIGIAKKRPVLTGIAALMSLADQRKLASGTLNDAPKKYGGRK